jgi:hypothetical protein
MWLLTPAGRIAGAALVLTLVVRTGVTSPPAGDLPPRLADAAFWSLVERFSEPDGYFDSDNLVSNEDAFQSVVPELAALVPAGRIYLGVGPDQNFTYILAVRPKLAFVMDVRRGNLHVHLLYKALIEMAPDRAEFLARLFGRARPAGVGAGTSVEALLRAYRTAPPSSALQAETSRLIADQLTRGGRFGLRQDDLPAIRAIHQEFVRSGPDLRFISSRGGNFYPTYMDLQVATDRAGVHHGYLTSEAHYSRLRDLQRANAIVPIVGNFGGRRTLRTLGQYLREHGEVVGAFYTSNVERYLFRDGLWDDFAVNLAELPVEASSTLIRSCFDSCSSPGESRAVTLLDSIAGLTRDVASGRVRSYWDVLSRSRK